MGPQQRVETGRLMNFRAWAVRLWGQTRAVDNARAASTELTRHRVQREEADIFVERLAERARSSRSA